MRLLLAFLLCLSAFAAERSDHAIEEEIRARFAKSKISTNGFQVKVQKGVATLSGKTAVIQHKGTATRIAKNAGATGVVNNIQISQQAREEASKRLATARETARSAGAKAAPAAAPTPGAAAPAPADPKPGDVPPPVRRAKIKH